MDWPDKKKRIEIKRYTQSEVRYPLIYQPDIRSVLENSRYQVKNILSDYQLINMMYYLSNSIMNDNCHHILVIYITILIAHHKYKTCYFFLVYVIKNIKHLSLNFKLGI
jgi:hypothetical protein